MEGQTVEGSWKNVKTCRMCGGRSENGREGVESWEYPSGWKHDRTGTDSNGERTVRCGTMMSSLAWFIFSQRKTQLLWAQLRIEVFHTVLSFSHLLSHIWMWFLVIFQALWNDSQTESLRNYVLLPEHDTRVQDVAADKVCTDKHTDSSEASLLHVSSSAWFYEMLLPPPFCYTVPAYYYFKNTWCQSSGNNLKRWVVIGIVEIWGLTLALPTCYPTTVKCPKEGVWNWIEMEERKAGELKAHTNRLRKRKS